MSEVDIRRIVQEECIRAIILESKLRAIPSTHIRNDVSLGKAIDTLTPQAYFETYGEPLPTHLPVVWI